MLEAIIKLSYAALVGLVLGIEREAKHKPLGLKTCAVIAIASCLLTIVSIQAATEAHNSEFFIRTDPMRLAAQIISGVGFLGAGVILRRNNDVISGLTTAAIVWAASGFGIAIGAGYYFEVAIGLALLVFAVMVLPYVMKRFGPTSMREQTMRLNVYLEKDVNVHKFISDVEKNVLEIKESRIENDGHVQKISLICTIHEGPQVMFEKYNIIREIEGVQRIDLESM